MKDAKLYNANLKICFLKIMRPLFIKTQKVVKPRTQNEGRKTIPCGLENSFP